MTIQIKDRVRDALGTLIFILFAALPTLAQKPELVIQTGHLDAVRAVAISPDGKLLASAGTDKVIILWDTVTGRQLCSLKGHSEWIFTLAFSQPNGKFLASGSSDGMVKLWNIVQGKQEYEISAQPYGVTSVAFSSDGNTLAISSADKVIKLWDMSTRTVKSELRGHTGAVTQVVFSPRGKALISSSLDKTLRFWNLETMESSVIGQYTEGFTSIDYSPDGRLIAMGVDDTIAVYDLLAGKIKIVIPPQDRPALPGGVDYRRLRLNFGDTLYPPGALAFSSNNELAFVDGFKLRLWDVEKDKEKLSREISSGLGGYAVTVNRNGNFLAFNDGNDLRLFNLGTGETKELKGGSRSVNAVAFSSNGKALAASTGADLGMWGDELGVTQRELYSVLAKLTSTHNVFLSSANVLAQLVRGTEGRWGPDIKLTDGASLKPLATLKAHAKAITSITGNEGSSLLASSSEDGTVKLWDVKNRSAVKVLQEHAEQIAFSPDGNLLATAGEKGAVVKLWDVKTWEPRVLNKPNIGINQILFSPDSKVLAAIGWQGFDKTLALWEVSTGRHLYSLNLDSTPENFSKESKRAFFPQNAYGFMALINDYPTTSGPLAFSPDSSLMACEELNRVTGTYNVKIWNVGTGKEMFTLAGHGASIRSVVFAPRSRVLASGSWDDTVKLWNIDTGQELATIVPLRNKNWVLFTPGGLFDTNINLVDVRSLNWVAPDDVLSPLSLDVFMRDYYESGLLQKILKGEPLRKVRDISQINRTQPKVKVAEVKPDSAGTVQVTVEVANAVSRKQVDSQGQALQSGVFDIRLLRDGQVVAYSTTDTALADYLSETGSLAKSQNYNEQELELWRRATVVRLDETGRARVTFHNIKLPTGGQVKEVSFSAYGFNRDRIKSETTPPSVYQLLAPSITQKPRAYVITFGVNAGQAGWNLDFAAKSSEDIRLFLRESLSSAYEVVSLPLLSTLETDSPRVALKQATKENMHTVLDILAGRVVSRERRRAVPNVEALRAATPDDLVILYISSHGYADVQGNFYVVPYAAENIPHITESTLNACPADSTQPPCDVARKFLARSISSDDFTAWWRGVDAREAVMILDSCYSAAAPGKTFRPGPLGDRSFGQLSYDKGMLILTATQPDRLAAATSRIGKGRSLLSDALITISTASPLEFLGDWLKEAGRLVPENYKKLYTDAQEDEAQLPVLFDFTKK